MQRPQCNRQPLPQAISRACCRYDHTCLQVKKQQQRCADKLSCKKKKKILQARADKLGTLGCKVALTQLSCKGQVSQINSASLMHALQACTAKQQLAMQQQLQDKPDALLQLMQVWYRRGVHTDVTLASWMVLALV